MHIIITIGITFSISLENIQQMWDVEEVARRNKIIQFLVRFFLIEAYRSLIN